MLSRLSLLLLLYISLVTPLDTLIFNLENCRGQEMVESKWKLFGLARACSITLAVVDTSLE